MYYMCGTIDHVLNTSNSVTIWSINNYDKDVYVLTGLATFKILITETISCIVYVKGIIKDNQDGALDVLHDKKNIYISFMWSDCI